MQYEAYVLYAVQVTLYDNILRLRCRVANSSNSSPDSKWRMPCPTWTRSSFSLGTSLMSTMSFLTSWRSSNHRRKFSQTFIPCLCIGGFQAPPAARFGFLITLSLLGGFFSNLAGVCSSPGDFFWNMLQWHFDQSERSHDQKCVFRKGVLVRTIT